MTIWYEDDAFWEAAEPVLFDEARLEAAGAEALAACNLLRLDAGARLLDLCTGPGRHAIALAQLGYRVTGVDRTRRYLDRALADALAAGVAIEWVQQDMREFRRDNAFDAVLNLFTSFGYFSDPADDRRVAANLHASLKPGGRAIFDLMGKEILARDFRERDWTEAGDTLLLEERQLGADFGWIESRWIVVDREGRRDFRISHRLYSGAELRALLLAAGFAEVEIYGSLEGDPYDQDAERLVVVATR